MSKKYPLDPKVLYEFEGGPMGYWSKGHHDPKEFCKAVIEQYAPDTYIPLPKGVKHEYWRNVPVPGHGGMILTTTPGSRRGAYPVTYICYEHCYIPQENQFGTYYYWRKRSLDWMKLRLRDIQTFRIYKTLGVPSWDYHLAAYCKGERWTYRHD